jgi:hypothetical protein
MVTVLIPWRPQPSRLAAFDAVTNWYRANVPEVDIRTVDSDDGIFPLARCRNLAVESIERSDDVVVIGDADTIPEAAPLFAAIAAASTSGRVHLPYTDYRWLGPTGTAQLGNGSALGDCSFDLVLGACSGVYVTTPETWWRHGGQDERFRGWGFEDAAWYLAHSTMLGEPPIRETGRVFALHHVAESRHGVQYDANAALMERYRAAAGSVDDMAQLIAESARIRPGV